MTITDFLLARIAEDEARARKLALTDTRPVLSLAATVNHPERLLAEAQAKRAIIEAADTYADEYENEKHRTSDDTAASRVAGRARSWRDDTLRTLAAIYSDHPDYNTAWRDE